MPDRATPRTVLVRTGWLLAELAVVFAGVYGAFLLDEYRQERQLERRRDQIIETLCREAGRVETNLSNFVPLYDSLFVRDFTRSYEAGERPIPRPLDFFAGSFEAGMWQTMLQSGGLDALELETITQAQRFYGALGNVASYGDALARRLESTIVPRLDDGTAAFYAPGTDRLKRAYRWYPSTVETLSYHLHTLEGAADSLLTDLHCADDSI